MHIFGLVGSHDLYSAKAKGKGSAQELKSQWQLYFCLKDRS